MIERIITSALLTSITLLAIGGTGLMFTPYSNHRAEAFFGTLTMGAFINTIFWTMALSWYHFLCS